MTLGQQLIRKGMDDLRRLLTPKRYERKRRRWGDGPPSGLELRVQAEMRRQGVEFREHVRFGRYVADIYLPHCNTIVECDGDYWHSLPGRAAKDRRRDAWFVKKGLKVIRLRESHINRNVARCVELVRKATE